MHLLAITLLFAAPLAGQNIQGFDSNTKATQWADSLMQHMSMDEKIGQLFMVAAYANRDTTHRAEILALVEDYYVGGLIFFQGSPIAQTKLLNSYQEQSRIPLWVGMDAEWGIGMRLDSAMSFPFQMTLGAIQDDALIYKMGETIGRQFDRMGMHINFAPVLDINNNAENPVINFRSFGENKHNVSSKARLTWQDCRLQIFWLPENTSPDMAIRRRIPTKICLRSIIVGKG